MREKNTLRNIVIILLFLVLIPTAFYTVYEFSSLNASEEILSEMYNRQLDAILYSVNDHATAVLTNWANKISKLYETQFAGLRQEPFGRISWGSRRDPAGIAEDSARFVARVENMMLSDFNVELIGFSDSTGKGFSPGGPFPVLEQYKRTIGQSFRNVSEIEWRNILKRDSWKLERLPRYLRTGYRKLEPVFLGDSTSARSRVLIVFALGTNLPINLMGVVLDETDFIQRVIGRKLVDIAGNSFILGIKERNSNTIVFSTEETKAEELRQQRTLWLFPGYELGIRLKGTTIDELAQSRTKRNFILIVLMDVVLFAGAWLVYRSIRREMELVRLKSDFVSNVSHELRTPLALIRMYGETLEMGRVTNETKKREYYGTIVKESERLTRLVNNILDFSKMEAGKKQYTFSAVQLNDVVRSVMATYDFHLKNEGFTATFDCDGSLPVISADGEAVTEAVVNLIDNAVKYSGEQKYLKVRTFLRDSRRIIEVEDHGVGIAAEHHPRIFDKFFRVGSALVHNTKGSGLGLTLVKHIMDAHRGKVEVDSVVGKGSRFRLVFPTKP